MGYELVTKVSSTSPECLICPAGYYCNAGSTTPRPSDGI
jgi:hypothetical protein